MLCCRVLGCKLAPRDESQMTAPAVVVAAHGRGGRLSFGKAELWVRRWQ